MAGMLPGVEAARRRRVHQSSSGPSIGTVSSPSFRRSSMSLYTPNSSATPSLVQERSRVYQQDDEKLGHLARAAKGRLDERLRASSFRRNNDEQSEESLTNGSSGVNVRELRREVYGSKKKNGGAKKLMGWANKLGWKAGEQEECVVCLEEFRVGDNLVSLPCAHRFHSTCLVPWLDSNAHCPCCRMSILPS